MSLQFSAAVAGALNNISNGMAKNARSGAPHRTGRPVRRKSREAGTFEHDFYRVPDKGEMDANVSKARRLADNARHLRRQARRGEALSAAERDLAPLTASMVRVYEELCAYARTCAGMVYPSFKRLMEKTGHGTTTIGRALKVLEKLGLIERQRRFRRVETSDPGPRYEQTSNAYRVSMPKALARFLPRWARPAPLPADVTQREQDHREEHALMMKSLSCKELAKATVGGELGEALALLGEGVDRENSATTE